MEFAPKPIYLLADGHLLFWKTHEQQLIESLIGTADMQPPQVAYIMAAGDYEPEFRAMVHAGMENAGVKQFRIILSRPSIADLYFINVADIIFLVSEEVDIGYRILQATGLNKQLVRRYHEGALLIGIAAGAIHLGLLGWAGAEPYEYPFETLKLVPFVVDVREEVEHWDRLRHLLSSTEDSTMGIGIPAGGGLLYRPDRTIEPLRLPLHQFTLQEGTLTQDLVMPQSAKDIGDVTWLN